MKQIVYFLSILIAILGSNFAFAQEPGPPPSPEPTPEPGPITIPGPKQIPNPFPGENSEEKIKRLQVENDKLRSENKQLESQKTSLEKEVTDLKKRISNLQAIIQEQIKVILDLVSKLKQDVEGILLNPARTLLS